MSNTLLTVRGLNTYYGASHILRGIDFTVGRGETIGLMGRNGMGKSTLLKLITGTTQPSTGSVGVHGRVAQCPVDLDGVEQLGQRKGLSHLDPHPLGACRSGLDQPQPRALAQVEELRFGGGPGTWPPIQRSLGLGREVLVVDPRRPRSRACVAGDLDWPVVADVDDDDVLLGADTLGADPHRFAQQRVRD